MKREDFIYLPDDVQKFLTHMTVIQNKSELTVNEYASDLRLFFRYLKKQKEEEENQKKHKCRNKCNKKEGEITNG